MIRPFSRKGSALLLTTPIFEVYEELRVHPGSGHEGRYVTLRSPDCVNVIALTPDRRLILVRQWRHGTLQEELELPAGLMDEGETPLVAAGRELLEETGFSAARLALIGEVRPNTAYQSNKCFTVLAEGCRQTARQAQDPQEDIEVDLVPEARAADLFKSGRLASALTASSLLIWLDSEARVRWPQPHG